MLVGRSGTRLVYCTYTHTRTHTCITVLIFIEFGHTLAFCFDRMDASRKKGSDAQVFFLHLTSQWVCEQILDTEKKDSSSSSEGADREKHCVSVSISGACLEKINNCEISVGICYNTMIRFSLGYLLVIWFRQYLFFWDYLHEINGNRTSLL